MAEWANPPSVHPALTLPKPNDFIPTDFELRADLPQYQVGVYMCVCVGSVGFQRVGDCFSASVAPSP